MSMREGFGIREFATNVVVPLAVTTAMIHGDVAIHDEPQPEIQNLLTGEAAETVATNQIDAMLGDLACTNTRETGLELVWVSDAITEEYGVEAGYDPFHNAFYIPNQFAEAVANEVDDEETKIVDWLADLRHEVDHLCFADGEVDYSYSEQDIQTGEGKLIGRVNFNYIVEDDEGRRWLYTGLEEGVATVRSENIEEGPEVYASLGETVQMLMRMNGVSSSDLDQFRQENDGDGLIMALTGQDNVGQAVDMAFGMMAYQLLALSSGRQ